MPCSDVTELIHVSLDPDNRLQHYTFSKRTCGQGVGAESLLINQLAGRSLDELLDYEGDDFLRDFPIEDELEEFLSLKHLYAVKSALEVFVGRESGGRGDAFAISGLEYGEDGGLTIEGQIAVELVTDRIKSCGGCKGCGKQQKVVFH